MHCFTFAGALQWKEIENRLSKSYKKANNLQYQAFILTVIENSLESKAATLEEI